MTTSTIDYSVKSERDLKRFWARVEYDPNSGCWLWTGSDRGNGYGCFNLTTSKGNYHTALAHRYAYTQLVGPVDPKMVLDHKCRTPFCVNPVHLEPVSTGENTKRSPAWIGRVTHCPHGHEYTPENIAPIFRKGAYVGRKCRACHRVRQRAYERRLRGA